MRYFTTQVTINFAVEDDDDPEEIFEAIGDGVDEIFESRFESLSIQAAESLVGNYEQVR